MFTIRVSKSTNSLDYLSKILQGNSSVIKEKLLISTDEECKLLSEVIKTKTLFTKLTLKFAEISSEGLTFITDALKYDNAITSISISFEKNHNENIKILAEALQHNNKLEILELVKNKIDKTGASHLEKMLVKNTSITHLYLGHNELGSEGAENIANGLKKNTSLKGLFLSWNKIGAKGCLHFANALKENTGLITLNLAANEIPDTGAAFLASLLEENTSLENLNLSENNFSDTGIQYFAPALKLNNTLISLALKFNPFGDRGAACLEEASGCNYRLEELTFSGCEVLLGGVDKQNVIDRRSICFVPVYHKSGDVYKQLISFKICYSTDSGDYIERDAGRNLFYELERSLARGKLEYGADLLKVNKYLESLGVSTRVIRPNIRGYLDDNEKIAACLLPLYELIKKNLSVDRLTVNIDVVTKSIAALEKIIPELNYSSRKKYAKEAHRLLVAIAHRGSYKLEAKLDALRCLLPGFKNPGFQNCADEALSYLLAIDLYEHLKNNKMDKVAMLLTLYILGYQLHIPVLNELAHLALFRLKYPEETLPRDGKTSSKSKVSIISHDKFSNIIQEAFKSCKTAELDFLKKLQADKNFLFTAKSAFQSPAFFNEFKKQYSNAEQFAFAEEIATQCILDQSLSFLIEVPKIQNCTDLIYEGYDSNLQKQDINAEAVEKIVDDLQKFLQSKLSPESVVEDLPPEDEDQKTQKNPGISHSIFHHSANIRSNQTDGNEINITPK